jgi:hypothetical protein
MAETRNVKHSGSSNKVLAYLRANPDVIIPYVEIERALTFPNYTVSNAVGRLIEIGHPIEKPQRGQCIYRSKRETGTTRIADPTVPLYEYIGSSLGRIVVRDENKELFVLMPIIFGDK